jgi:hypothetical protein
MATADVLTSRLSSHLSASTPDNAAVDTFRTLEAEADRRQLLLAAALGHLGQ